MIIMENKISERIHDIEYHKILKLTNYNNIHDEIRRITLDSDNFEEDLSQYVRKIYNDWGFDRGILRTLLISLKPILRNHSFIEPIYNNIAYDLREKSETGKI